MVEKQCVCGKDTNNVTCKKCGKYICEDHQSDLKKDGIQCGVCGMLDFISVLINRIDDAITETKCVCGQETNTACLFCGKYICEKHSWKYIIREKREEKIEEICSMCIHLKPLSYDIKNMTCSVKADGKV